MHPRALLEACADLVGLVLKFEHPADQLVSRYFREHRNLGQNDRAFVAETVFAVCGASAPSRQPPAPRGRARELASFPAILHRIAACESHGDPRAIGGGGLYRGAFQFSRSTWAAVGGQGDPAAAPLLEQYRRAQLLLERSGPGQWPVCAA